MTIVTIVVVKPYGSGGSSSSSSYIVSLSSSIAISRLRALLNITSRNYITLFLVSKYDRYIDAMRPILQTFGTYTFQDGRKSLALISRVFEVAGQVDLIIFDTGGSGGVYQVDGKTIGTGKEQIEPFLNEADEEEDAGDSGTIEPQAEATKSLVAT